MMKTALCLYGQPRTLEFCAPSIQKHLIDKFNADVFCCSDSQGDRIEQTYHPKGIEIHSGDEIKAAIGNRISRYGESVPNPGPYKEYPIYPPIDLMFMYQVWRTGQLLRDYEVKNGKYDFVMGSRFDAKYLKVPTINPKENTFCIPRIDAQGGILENGIHWNIGYSSHFWCAPAEIGYQMLDAYHWTDQCFRETGQWAGEAMLKHYCDKNNIKVKFIEVDFMLIRGSNQQPRSALPPWSLLSETNHPEYLPKEWEKEKAVQFVEPPHATGFNW
jgi:hypothetical protein